MRGGWGGQGGPPGSSKNELTPGTVEAGRRTVPMQNQILYISTVPMDFEQFRRTLTKGVLDGLNKGRGDRNGSSFPGTFDPLSVFYSFRLHDLEKYKEFETPVTDGKKCVMGTVRVIKREKIKVEGTYYDTYLVEPDIKDLRGVFQKSKDASLKIWVTADKHCIPVRIKSKVIVGSFVADLVSFEPGTPEEVSDSSL